MKFSFIHPSPNIELSESQREMAPASWPPLGILYAATVLEREGVEVSVLDQAAKVLSVEETVKWIRREDPQVLGFSTLTNSGRMAARIAKDVKEVMPDITIVFGNCHATFNAKRILEKYPFVDVIVRGEGEYTCIDLVRCLERGGSLKKVPGISFKKGKEVLSTPEGAPIRNLDVLPIPNRELLDVQYSSAIFGIPLVTKKFTSILSSRGCPYRCTFCGCRKFSHGLWRTRSIENILREFHFLESEGFKQFLFVDDLFTASPKRVMNLCRSMRREGIDVEWMCESRVDNCPQEMLDSMVKAGCRTIYFGIESANQRILDYYSKGITPDQSKLSVRKARRAGIDVIVGSFILGATYETKGEVLNTLNFAKEIDIDVPQFNVLSIFPGSDIWEELVKKGVLDEKEYWETGVRVAEVSPWAVPHEELKRMIQDGFRDFFYRRGFILRALLRSIKSSYRFKILTNGILNFSQVVEGFRQASQTF